MNFNLKNKLKHISKMTFSILLIIIIAGILFVNFHPTFGGNSKGESLDKIKISKNYNGKKFSNLISTTTMTSNSEKSNQSMLSFFIPSKGKNPDKPLPSKKFDKKNVKDSSFTWLGHSTILMKTSNVTIISDPLFYRASPIIGVGKPFEIQNPTMIEDLPKIDVVIISHDHYDHLDHKAIKEIDDKVSKYLVPLGVKAHLLKWGIDEKKIEEKDWYENVSYKNVNFTFTPSRHFSGRGLTNQDTTLWGSWVIKSKSKNIFFSGDTGYYDEFKNIGKKYGPFDIAFIENGAYNKDWATIHLMPEEGVQVNIDLKSKVFFPIHWSKFDLAYHNWDEPIIRVTKEAKKKNVTVATPLIGETFTLEKLPQDKWWEKLRE